MKFLIDLYQRSQLSKKLIDYLRFMRKEAPKYYSASFAKQKIILHNENYLLEAIKNSGAIVSFLHHGRLILIGTSIAKCLSLPYTHIQSKRHLRKIKYKDEKFWEAFYKINEKIYGNPIIYTDQSPWLSFRWLKNAGNVLGVALDAQIYSQKVEQFQFDFLDRPLFLQVRPARLACLTGAPIIPAAIHYLPKERRYHVYFEAPIYPNGNPQEMTQRALHALEKIIAKEPAQGLQDIFNCFGKRRVVFDS